MVTREASSRTNFAHLAPQDWLAPSILEKAFRGDHVPQDHTDEPAADLLGRMGTQQSGPADPPKPKRAKPRARA